LDVRYDRPVEEVYTRAAWSMIQKYRNLDILGHCSPSEGTHLELPSWVPDWTAKSSSMHFFKRGASVEPHEARNMNGVDIDEMDIEIGKLYNASGDGLAQVSLDSTGRRLSCKGFQLDRIRHISPTAGTTLAGVEVVVPWTEWFSEISLTFPPASTHLSRDAFCRTLTSNCYRVAVDVGVRGCAAELSSVAAGEEIGSMDITGPHPATFRRRLVLTENGYLGLTAEHAQPEDWVVILMGGQVPFVLRQVDAQYVLVGEAYIHGMMDGEALALWEVDTATELSTFEIW